MASLIRKSLWYVASTFVLAITSIGTVPILIHSLGAVTWAGLAAGMAVGTIAAIGVAWGWGVVGPGLIASASAADREGLYLRSVRERARLCVPFGLGAVVVAFVAVPTVREGASLQALAVALTGLCSPWFFVGAMRARSLFLRDTLPRTLSNVIGALVALATGDAIWFGALQVLGSAGAICLTHSAISRGRMLAQLGDMSWRELLGSLRPHNPAVLTAAVAAMYLSLPLLIVTAVQPAEAPMFALGDRLLKWSVTGLTPLTQALQGWMPARGGSSRRLGVGVWASGVVGLVLCLAITVIGPSFTTLLTKGALTLPLVGCAAVGVSVLSTTVSRVVGPAILVPSGRLRTLSASAGAGAAVGLACLFPLLAQAGAVGALWAVGAAELTVTSVQMAPAVKVVKRRDGT